MKRAGALLSVLMVLVLVTTGCEPAMTITAKDDAFGDILLCEQMSVAGVVTPATATTKAVLQRTIAGKWTDVQGLATWGAERTLRQAKVNQTTGAYSIPWIVDIATTTASVTMHLRVRSAGGTPSPGFYVRIDGIDGYC